MYSTTTLSSYQRIDRYTLIQAVETQAQSDVLDVVVTVYFPENITNVKAAIDYLLLRSGFGLSNRDETHNLSRLSLPEVHRQLGPIKLKRAIEVLIGPERRIAINRYDRIVQVIGNKQPSDDTILVVEIDDSEPLEEPVEVYIDNETLTVALKKILPDGWNLLFENDKTAEKLVNIVSENRSVREVVTVLASTSDSKAYFYPDMKILVIQEKEDYL